MKIQQASRITEKDEIQSSYTVGNLTVNWASRFNGSVTLEDTMCQTVLQRIRTQKNPEKRQGGDIFTR